VEQDNQGGAPVDPGAVVDPVDPGSPNPTGGTAATGSDDSPTPGGQGEDVSALREQLEAEGRRRAAAEAQARAERQKRQELEQQRQQPAMQADDFDPFDPNQIESVVERRLAQREQQQAHQAFMSKRPAEVTDEMFQMVGTAISGEAANLIKGRENSWDIIKHLGTNPEALSRLAGKSGADAAFELGQMVLQMQPATRSTSAPDPINPVTGGTADVGGEPPEGASLTQVEAHIRKLNGGSVFPKVY